MSFKPGEFIGEVITLIGERVSKLNHRQVDDAIKFQRGQK